MDIKTNICLKIVLTKLSIIAMELIIKIKSNILYFEAIVFVINIKNLDNFLYNILNYKNN